MSKTYRKHDSHLDDDDRAYIQSAIEAQSEDFGWFNLTGMGELMPAANRYAADVRLYMYGEPSRKECAS